MDVAESKTSEELLAEIAELKKRISQLKVADRGYKKDLGCFNERLEEEVARSSRYKYEFSIMLLKMDRYEVYSDRLKEEVKEEILNMLETVMNDTLRNSDLQYNFSKGQFGVILPYTNSEGAHIAAEKVRQAIERKFTLKSNEVNIKLTASAGIASYPIDAVSREELFMIGKTALSTAEQEGGNRIQAAGERSRLTSHDKETNIHHLRNDSFIQVLDEELIRCTRYRLKFSLVIVAVTNLEIKGINMDSVVKAGIMRATFKLLNAGIRNIDKGYLYTDSRFAVILPNTGFDGALTVSEKLVQSLSKNPVARNNGIDINVSVNVGIATFPTDELSREGLLRRAEEALELSIRKGANQVGSSLKIIQASRDNGRDIQVLINKIREAGPTSIYSLLSAVDVIEHYKHSHSQAVARFAMATGISMGLSNISIKHLRVMGLLHDMGKVCLPENIITKPGPLSDDEWDIMMKHPQLCVNMLEQFSDFSYCCLPILAHHERPDGKGYPRALKIEQIPLESRIIAVAEAYDDMVTARPYRQAVLHDEAVEELKNQSGNQFDASVVKAFINAITSLESAHTVN